MRKRWPARCNALRTSISGPVFFDLILDMIWLRVDLSVISGSLGVSSGPPVSASVSGFNCYFADREAGILPLVLRAPNSVSAIATAIWAAKTGGTAFPT